MPDGLQRRALRAAAVLALSVVTACAVMRSDNRLTLNALDEHLSPSSTAGRWAVAPVALPVGLVALVADAFVVHPATVFDDTWGDTVDWLWTPDPDESRFRRAVLLPLITLATPVVYVGDWFRRAFFAVPPRESEP